MKSQIFYFFLLSMLYACKPNATTEPEQMPDDKAFAYLHLTGTIGDDPAQMNLIQDLNYDGNPWYNGSYTLDKAQEPISFYTDTDTTGQGLLILAESYYGGESFGGFKGKLEDGAYRGEYTSKDGKKAPFVLTYTFPQGTMRFTNVRLEEVQAADEKLKDSPKGSFRYEYLKPAKEDWLNAAFLKEIVGDSLAQVYKTVEKAFAGEKKSFFDGYFEEAKALLGEDSDYNATFLNYESEKSMEVLFNQDKLLSIAVVDYSYSGGAHGNYGSSCASFDLTKQKKISLEDLFKPGYEKKLTAALNAAARKKYNVKKLSEVLFVEEVELNGNFFVTGKGICFNYVPYEIASYAQGEQKIFIPFTELKGIMK